MDIRTDIDNTCSANEKKCTDHLGNPFESETAMCRHWNIPLSTYESRINKYHWALEQALTTPVKEYEDVYGNKFKNNKEMCEAYHVELNTFRDNIQNNKSMIEALGIIPLLSQHMKNYVFDEHLTIIEPVNHKNKSSYTPKYFICTMDNHEVMLTRKTILRYCEEHLPEDKNPMRKC